MEQSLLITVPKSDGHFKPNPNTVYPKSTNITTCLYILSVVYVGKSNFSAVVIQILRLTLSDISFIRLMSAIKH